MMRYFLTIAGFVLVLCAPRTGAAQPEVEKRDSVPLFTRGDITLKVFDVETIEVRPRCECTGECHCTEAADRDENKFATTDAVLAKTPRVTLIRRGEFAPEPVLNGMNSDRFNLTIDGMKIFAACTDKMDPVTAYVESNNLRDLSVHSGAAGGEFGSTIAGSIDMKTQGAKLRPDTPLEAEIGMGYGSAANSYTGLFSVNHSGNRYAISANAMYREAGNYRAGGGATVPFTQFRKWNGAISGLVMVGKRHVLKADLIIDRAYDVGYPALPMDVEYANANILGVTHIFSPSSGVLRSLETKIYRNSVEHVMDDTKRPDVFMHMDMPGYTTTFGAYSKADFGLGAHRVLVKVDAYHTNALAEMTMYPAEEDPMFMLTWPDVDRESLGLYASDTWTFDASNALEFGLRVEMIRSTVLDDFGRDQASVFGQDLSGADLRTMPTAHLTYRRTFGKGMRAWMTAGYTERAPNVSEQYGFYLFNSHDGYDYIGQVDLKNERAWQLDLGFDANAGGWDFRTAVFGYKMPDYILGVVLEGVSPMTHGGNGVKMYRNIGTATMAGASLRAAYEWKNGWELKTTATYTFATNDDGGALPLIPPFENRTSLRRDFKTHFALVEVESAAGQNRVDELYGETPTAGYALLHLRGGTYFEWNGNRLNLSAGVENILDKKYTVHLDWGGIHRPGRNVFVNASFSF